MARIPTTVSQIDARSSAPTGSARSRQATGASFGAAQGAALQNLGAGFNNLATGLEARADKKRDEDVANKIAQGDFTRTELELRNKVGEGAEGYQEATLSAYDDWVDAQAEDIEDDKARSVFKQRMLADRNNVSSRAAQYEMGVAAQNSKDQAGASLTSLDNKIRLNPGAYDDYISQGFEVLDARTDIPAHVIAGMKRTWSQSAALSRFEGALEAATTVQDVQTVQEELRDTKTRDWTKEMSADGLERVMNLADAASKSIQTKADADARAAIDYLEGRASDVTTSIPKAELMAVQDLVSVSANPVTGARMARIMRDQQIVSQSRKLTPEQQRDIMDTRYADTSLPPRLNTAITNAANRFGVSASYLAATAKREYGMFLTSEDKDAIDYGKGNAEGASSATGVMQFIDDTWLDVARNPTFQAAAGVKTSSMSDEDVLALRKNPEIALMGGAFFTAQNAKTARSALGREPTDADLYVMHFMGAGAGPELFRLVKTDPHSEAATAFPEQAKANKSVYYDAKGKPRTVREVYNELGRKHGEGDGSETYMEYEDRATREKVLKDTETRLADDPIDFALKTGTAVIGDIFEEGGMSARGEQARSVADYYSIPAGEMKPFTKTEADALAAQFKSGTADEVLGMITSIQGMGGGMAKAALSQLGEVSDVYAYAGGLQMETGQGSVAAEVVKGQKRLDENPDIAKQMGANPTEISDAFLNATGGALLDAAPQQRQAIMDAATAHYVETQVARGRAGAFSQEKFTESVQAVLGGRKGAPSVGEVNGASTVLPPGITDAAMENALQNMTVADWTSMSEQGEPPRYVTGEIANAKDLADDVRLKAIGGGKYRVATSDGSYLITGRPAPNGQLEPYIFSPTPDAVNSLNERGATFESLGTGLDTQADDVQSALADGNLTTQEQRALFKKYGAMWAYDRDGNRIVSTP